MDAEDRSFCDQVTDDVANYITEMELKFITGEESLDNFDLFTAQLEKMGVGKALDIYRRYYEAYRAK